MAITIVVMIIVGIIVMMVVAMIVETVVESRGFPIVPTQTPVTRTPSSLDNVRYLKLQIGTHACCGTSTLSGYESYVQCFQYVFLYYG